MKDFLEEARGELVRADHLIYVSLKYTRTVDVIKSCIDRLINTFDSVILGLLEEAKEQGKIEVIPPAPIMKASALKNLHKDNMKIQNFMDLYLFLRKVTRAKFTRAREYRRHVTMTAFVDEEYIEITIDIITEYYHRAREFMEYAEADLKDPQYI